MIKKILIANRGEIALRAMRRRREEKVIFIGPEAESIEAMGEKQSS